MIRFLGHGLLLASVVWGMLNILQHSRLEQRSPYDEHTHFDYWYKIRHEHRIPAVYEPIRREALEIWACQSRYRLLAVSCAPDGRLTGPDPKVENTASPYLPTYYLATAMVSEFVDLIPHAWDEFQLAKISNMAWGLLSLCFMALLSLQLGIPPAVGALLLFASAQTPSFVYLSTTLNPEVFVLLGTVAGLWIHLRTADRFRTQWRWVATMAAVSACVLTVKPTALLLPVCIAVLEFAQGPSLTRQRLLRASAYLFGTLAVYLAISSLTNQFRDVFQSDGVMRDYMMQRIGGRTFGTNMEMVFHQFQYSITSPGWRALVDWNLPHVFVWLPKYVQLTALLLLAHAGWTLISGQTIGVHAALHAGALAGCLALPLALFVYLKLADFPFFFQSRYFMPYLMVSSVTATAFVCSALPTGFRFAKQRLAGSRDPSTSASPPNQHP
jgi:hypothetical protein